MFIQRKHLITDPDEVFGLIEANPLGAWVCSSEDGLVANHIPFFLDRERGPHGTLIAHVARGNPVWKQLADGRPSVVMFRGADAYISATWYPEHRPHGKVVPTWNYEAVNAHGIARAVHDRDWLLMMLNRLNDAQEAPFPQPWRVDEAPADYLDKMLRAIVGIEIPIDRLEAKRKASQGEAVEDREGCIAGLRRLGTPQAARMAALIERTLRTERPAPKYLRHADRSGRPSSSPAPEASAAGVEASDERLRYPAASSRAPSPAADRRAPADSDARDAPAADNGRPARGPAR